MWTDKLVALATLAGTVALVVTACLAIWGLVDAQRTRLATLVSDLTRRWDEPLMRRARLEFSSLEPDELLNIVQASYQAPRGPEDRIYLRLQALPNFFEYLAVLEESTRGVDVEMINRLWRNAILITWRRWEPTIQWIRDEGGTRTYYANFERLAREIWAMPEAR
jgi:hypothetical protein